MNELYIFNPEHDLALANTDRHFNAPKSACQLAHDLACLPLWYASDEGIIQSLNAHSEWYDTVKKLFPKLPQLTNQTLPEVSALCPWGWDHALLQKVYSLQPHISNLPSDHSLAQIRELSHRRNAVAAHRYVFSALQSHTFVAEPAIELKELSEAESFSIRHGNVIFKAPWSGSGKGLSWLRGRMTESHKGWCRNIMAKQGSVIAERMYEKIQDFALLYECKKGKVIFEGFSLFETEKGIYRSNALLSNDAILLRLCQWIPYGLIDESNMLLQQYITSEIAPHYNGMLGVDMFVFREKGSFKLHPCVEINLRMTMGYVARRVHDRFVQEGCCGHYYIDHYNTPAALLADHRQRETEQALTVVNGRIQKGYLSLTPIDEETRYRVRVEIE